MKSNRSVQMCGILLLAGCSSGNKPALERGWVGAVYETVPRGFSFDAWHPGLAGGAELPETVAGRQSSAVLVTDVFDSTPAQAAGLQGGDIILEAGGKQVESASQLHALVDAAPPGSRLGLVVHRAGEILELEVVVGKENLNAWSTIWLGFTPWLSCDLFPNPDFDVFGLVGFQSEDRRVELHAPRQKALRSLKSNEDEDGTSVKTDGWQVRLVLLGFGRKREVFSQEN